MNSVMMVMAVSLHLSMGSDRHLRRGLRRTANTSCKTLLASPRSMVSLLMSSMALFLVDLFSSFRQLRCRASPFRTSAAACSSPAAMPKTTNRTGVLSEFTKETKKAEEEVARDSRTHEATRAHLMRFGYRGTARIETQHMCVHFLFSK